MSLFLLMLQLLLALRLAVSANIALPNCSELCGKVNIPYPFGVGDNCYYEKAYEIICNKSFTPPKPFLRKFNVEVQDINWPGKYSRLDPRYSEQVYTNLTVTVGLQSPNLCPRNGTKEVKSFDFRDSPFLFSRWHNVFVVEGCGGSVVLKNTSGDILTGCASFCDSDSGKKSTNKCYGVGCCQASLLSSPTSDLIENGDDGDLDYYEVSLDFEQPTSNSCNIAATLIESKSVNKFVGKLSSLPKLPTVLQWQGIYTPSHNYNNFTCYNQSNTGPICLCYFPYEGNPFVPNGCQVLEECRKCKHGCALYENQNGPAEYIFCKMNPGFRRATVIGCVVGLGFILFLIGGYMAYRIGIRRKEIKKKATNFKRNGGLLLKQKMSSEERLAEQTRLFTSKELEKATDRFNADRVLGRGGQGIVYKGMLSDGNLVAIKKHKIGSHSPLEDFINEIAILSELNHRNIVKLIGCCLETDVPLLVYEFVLNGTLSKFVHDPQEEFPITWEMRLQIALDVAGALTYLHSASSKPILHKDIKSSNILLDAKYRAKLSDFGTSRSIAIDQTHLTTRVQGTFGYLDPEYFQSSKYTEKSDVYSFGVVLVELLTGKKAVVQTASNNGKSLVSWFLSSMENSSLYDILADRVVNEAPKETILAIAKLARLSLNMDGSQRPTMRQVSLELEAISHHRGASISFLS